MYKGNVKKYRVRCLPPLYMGVSSGHIYMEDKQRTRKKFKNTLIYPDLDVESICDVPRVPRTHLDVVFAQTIHVYYSTPV